VDDLCRTEIVVTHDRKRGWEAGGAAAAIHLSQHAVDARLSPRARRTLVGLLAGVTRRVPELIAAAAEQLLEVLHQVIGLATAAPDEVRHHLIGVVAGDPAPAYRVVEHLLDPVARDHHEVELADRAGQRVAERLQVRPDDVLGGAARAGPGGAPAPRRAPLRRRAALRRCTALRCRTALRRCAGARALLAGRALARAALASRRGLRGTLPARG